ncbi:arginase family protein [Dactylosporangium sp. NPDC051541]|uniref:arginase family protein n=1 Tax=Dactylosporangium sp. NPDC051541 TaxID=3363977 RepID=UPI0037AD31EB
MVLASAAARGGAKRGVAVASGAGAVGSRAGRSHRVVGPYYGSPSPSPLRTVRRSHMAGRWSPVVAPWHLDEYIPAFPVPVGAGEAIRPELPAGSVPGRMSVLHRAIADAVAQVARPLVLSGDCPIARAVVGGVQRRHRDLAVVWLDAHGDFNTPAISISGYLGGMAISMLTGRTPGLFGDGEAGNGAASAAGSGAASAAGSGAANAAGSGAASVAGSGAASAAGSGASNGVGSKAVGDGVSPLPEANVVLADARDLDPAERDALAASQVRLVAAEPGAITAALRDLAGLPVYLHLDVDVLDSADVPGLRFPTEAGPSIAQIEQCLAAVCATADVVAAGLACTWQPDRVGDAATRDAITRLARALGADLAWR